MKKLSYLVLSFSLIFILVSCSSSEQTTKTEKPGEDSVYVFDEVPAKTTPVKETALPVQPARDGNFIIQIGAFTSKEKAEQFAQDSRLKLNRDVIIIFSNTVNLFVVQLTDPFITRAEAEVVRNELWTMNEFKDAWILTVSK